MSTETIKAQVAKILKEVSGKRAAKMIESMEDRAEGVIVYLCHGATLGEAWEIQDQIQAAGLRIPDQMGNALIYVTK